MKISKGFAKDGKFILNFHIEFKKSLMYDEFNGDE